MLVKKTKPGFWLMLVIVLGSCGAGLISGRPGFLWFLPLHIIMAREGLFDADTAHWTWGLPPFQKWPSWWSSIECFSSLTAVFPGWWTVPGPWLWCGEARWLGWWVQWAWRPGASAQLPLLVAGRDVAQCGQYLDFFNEWSWQLAFFLWSLLV